MYKLCYILPTQPQRPHGSPTTGRLDGVADIVEKKIQFDCQCIAAPTSPTAAIKPQLTVTVANKVFDSGKDVDNVGQEDEPPKIEPDLPPAVISVPQIMTEDGPDKPQVLEPVEQDEYQREDTTAIRPPVEPDCFIAFLSRSRALRLGSGGLTRDLHVSRVLSFGFWGNKAAI
ncbi:hypothetical protein B0H14DRAFT_2588974 [Mycena olivaceomarginata]|nr:hypothetical protein B0H14DRAFT_2588974 [Mycena olivaceomarginata]